MAAMVPSIATTAPNSALTPRPHAAGQDCWHPRGVPQTSVCTEAGQIGGALDHEPDLAAALRWRNPALVPDGDAGLVRERIVERRVAVGSHPVTILVTGTAGGVGAETVAAYTARLGRDTGLVGVGPQSGATGRCESGWRGGRRASATVLLCGPHLRIRTGALGVIDDLCEQAQRMRGPVRSFPYLAEPHVLPPGDRSRVPAVNEVVAAMLADVLPDRAGGCGSSLGDGCGDRWGPGRRDTTAPLANPRLTTGGTALADARAPHRERTDHSLRWLFTHLRNPTLRDFGLHCPTFVEARSPVVPLVETKAVVVDALLVGTDGSVWHLEFEMGPANPCGLIEHQAARVRIRPARPGTSSRSPSASKAGGLFPLPGLCVYGCPYRPLCGGVGAGLGLVRGSRVRACSAYTL